MQVEDDRQTFYLVRISPKRNIFSICNRDDFPRLRFFIYQCMFKRKGYIIPKLEWVHADFPFIFSHVLMVIYHNRKWIPGIGIDLITGDFTRTPTMQRCTANKEEDYQLADMTNIFHAFTECGSLSPVQMCALFQFFRQTPMYTMSSFHQQFDHFYATKRNRAVVTYDPDDEADPTFPMWKTPSNKHWLIVYWPEYYAFCFCMCK